MTYLRTYLEFLLTLKPLNMHTIVLLKISENIIL